MEEDDSIYVAAMKFAKWMTIIGGIMIILGMLIGIIACKTQIQTTKNVTICISKTK